jgi:hypothetical protein
MVRTAVRHLEQYGGRMCERVETLHATSLRPTREAIVPLIYCVVE